MLFIVVLIGAFIRIYHLDQNIPQLYSDETGHYYHLYSFYDAYTNIFSKLFYGTFSATWLFGLSPLGVRLPAALWGLLSVLAAYYLASAFDKRTSLVLPFLVAVLPWSFSVSRIGHTHVPIVLFFSLLFLGSYIRAKTIILKYLSFLLLVFGGYYYPSLIFVLPVVMLPLLIHTWQNKKNNVTYILATLLFISLVAGYFLINKYQIFSSNSRGLDLAIWRDVNVTADANLYRGIARNSDPTIFSFYQDPEKIANKLVFNYPVSVISVFFKNYLSFFSPEFLFLKGDNILRHSTGMVGEFYLYLLPFMIYGAFIFYSSKSPHKTFLTLWLLASPIPAAITKDGATYLLRAITMMPILTYFCARGIVSSFDIFKKKYQKIIFGTILSVVAIYSSYYYFYGYFHVYPSLAADSFEYGFKDLADFQIQNPGKLLILWEDKYPYTQFCFWQNLPYYLCKSDQINNKVMSGKTRVDLPLPNIIFALPASTEDLNLVVSNFTPNYIAVPKKYSETFKLYFDNKDIVKKISNPDQSTSFTVYKTSF